jgi:hypothetical protein
MMKYYFPEYEEEKGAHEVGDREILREGFLRDRRLTLVEHDSFTAEVIAAYWGISNARSWPLKVVLLDGVQRSEWIVAREDEPVFTARRVTKPGRTGRPGAEI